MKLMSLMFPFHDWKDPDVQFSTQAQRPHKFLSAQSTFQVMGISKIMHDVRGENSSKKHMIQLSRIFFVVYSHGLKVQKSREHFLPFSWYALVKTKLNLNNIKLLRKETNTDNKILHYSLITNRSHVPFLEYIVFLGQRCPRETD